MSGHMTTTTQHMVRANVWTRELKDIALEELQGTKYVKWLEFPDGDTLNMPSIGEMESRDYVEGQQIEYTSLDTGNFTFTIQEYKSAATYITAKARQDWFYAAQLEAMFIPKAQRALAVAMEEKLLRVGPDAQTLGNANLINGAKHRFVASGTNATVTPQDFLNARYALRKAFMPTDNLVAIVDPSVAQSIGKMTNIVNVSFNPRWEGIVREGVTSGMQFRFNIFGIDIYESDFLKTASATETIDGVAASGANVNNLVFSANSNWLPFVGAIRQAPKVDSEWNKDLQREEYVVTCRYDFKLFRPENLVTIVSRTDQVYA